MQLCYSYYTLFRYLCTVTIHVIDFSWATCYTNRNSRNRNANAAYAKCSAEMEETVKTEKNNIWNFNEPIDLEPAGDGVMRKILSYTDTLMVVENHFDKGAVGALHHHPHTQITYVVSGQFEFEIAGEKKIVNPGDSMLKMDGIEHGCVCLQEGILLDIFTPMREDFV